jgi:hypothetical protein
MVEGHEMEENKVYEEIGRITYQESAHIADSVSSDVANSNEGDTPEQPEIPIRTNPLEIN